jgi:hypothetical protein
VPVPLNPLIDAKRHHTPADLHLANAASRIGTVERLAGPTGDFLDAVLPSDLMTTARTLGEAAIEDAAQAGLDANSGIEIVRELLAEEEARLHRDAVRAIAHKLLGAYGTEWPEENETSIETTLDDVIGPFTQELTAATADSDVLTDWERTQLHLVDQGRFLDAADRFLDYIGRADPDTTTAYTDTALWILDDLFWRAWDRGDYLPARWLATKMRREARRRRSLWGQVRSDFLEAIVFDAWSRSEAVLAGRRRHEPAWYQARARTLMENVVHYAFRIPHLPMLVDALGVAESLAADDEDRERIRRARRRWERTVAKMTERTSR